MKLSPKRYVLLSFVSAVSYYFLIVVVSTMGASFVNHHIFMWIMILLSGHAVLSVPIVMSLKVEATERKKINMRLIKGSLLFMLFAVVFMIIVSSVGLTHEYFPWMIIAVVMYNFLGVQFLAGMTFLALIVSAVYKQVKHKDEEVLTILGIIMSKAILPFYFTLLFIVALVAVMTTILAVVTRML